MDQFFQMLHLQISQIILLAIGALAYRQGFITDDNRSGFTQVLLQIMMPALVFNSFKAFQPDMLITGIQALLASMIIYTLLTLTGQFFYHDLGKERQTLLHYATLVNNVGLGGQPLSTSMYGDIGAILSSIYLIPHRIFMWTAGISILSSGQKQEESVWSKVIKNPSIIAVFLGLLRGFIPYEVPEVIDRPITLLARAVSPLAALVIGSILASTNYRHLFAPGVLRYAMIRLIAIPLITLMIGKFLHLDQTLIGVLTIMTAMPAGTTTALLAAQYALDPEYASKLVFVTTLASVFTVPLMIGLI